MSEGLDFGAMERALAAWISRVTGFPAEATSTGGVARVIAENLQVPQPPLPYATYLVPVPRNPGGQDEVRETYEPLRPRGQEIALSVHGQRELIVTVKVFTKAAAGGQDLERNLTARQYLSRIETSLSLPGINETLQCAGLVYVDVVGRADFSARLGPAGQGRGQIEVRFRAVEVMTERTGYIGTAEVTSTLS